MPIGTTAAIIGSAVIGAGASALSSHSNSKAINKASDAQARAAEQNTALQRDIYNQNRNVLSPYIQSGYGANQAINALLGIPTEAMPANDAVPAPNALNHDPRTLARINYMPVLNGGTPLGQIPTLRSPEAGTVTAAPQSDLDPYEAAFQNYLGSTGYQFRLGEGNKTLNASFAARGLGNSGAAAKAAIEYGQNFGTGYFNDYLAHLGNQQGVGLSAGNALAGVGTAYANNVGTINQGAADAIGNAAIAKANNTGAFFGNIAGIAGNALGQISSYGRVNPYGVIGAGSIY